MFLHITLGVEMPLVDREQMILNDFYLDDQKNAHC
jgi:hypothetical protein